MNARSLWELLREPRFITALMSLDYVLFILIAWVSWADPSDYISHAWGHWVGLVWPLIIGAGGLLGLVGAPRGWWWIEKPGLMLCATMIATRIIALYALHRSGTPGNQAIQIGFDLQSLILLGIRWWKIRNCSLDPTR